MGDREANAELHRRHREAALAMRVRRIPLGDGLAAAREVARLLQLLPDGLDAVVPDLLAVVRRVRLAFAVVQVAFAHDLRRQAKPPGNPIEDFLDDHHPLRPAEPAKGGVRGQVGLGHLPAEFDCRECSRRCRDGTTRGPSRPATDPAPSRHWNRDAPARPAIGLRRQSPP